MFRGFMYGRYGFDKLNLFLVVVLLILGIASIVTRFLSRWFFWPALILMILQMLVIICLLFRVLSKNIERRRRENDAFMRFTANFKGFFGKMKVFFSNFFSNTKVFFIKIKDFFVNCFAKIKKPFADASVRRKDKEHKYFKCPKCKARLRVPKGRGRITVTCPRCGNKFDKKS